MKGYLERKQSRHHAKESIKLWEVFLRADTGRRKVGGENEGGDMQNDINSWKFQSRGRQKERRQSSDKASPMGGRDMTGIFPIRNNPRMQGSWDGRGSSVSEKVGETSSKILEDMRRGTNKEGANGERRVDRQSNELKGQFVGSIKGSCGSKGDRDGYSSGKT
jgi:hypothetical protein